MSATFAEQPTVGAAEPSERSGGTAHMLVAERKAATFDIAALTKIVNGKTPAAVKEFAPLFSSPLFADQHLDDYAGQCSPLTRAHRVTPSAPSGQSSPGSRTQNAPGIFCAPGTIKKPTILAKRMNVVWR